jgi:hypothetical protein
MGTWQVLMAGCWSNKLKLKNGVFALDLAGPTHTSSALIF